MFNFNKNEISVVIIHDRYCIFFDFIIAGCNCFQSKKTVLSFFYSLKSMPFASVTDTCSPSIQIKGRNIDTLPEQFHSVHHPVHIDRFP